jgi:hypothetical protein
MPDQESDTDENTTNESTTDGIDDRRMILPYVNTDTRLIPWITEEEKTVREAVVYVPGGLALAGAGFAFWFGAFIVGFLLLPLALVLFAVGVYLDLTMSRAWYLTPDGVLKEYLSYRFLQRSLPWGHKETVRNTHNIRCIHEDGDRDD